jgi:Bacterial archaeo-eukaryotic release factor family 11
MLHVDVPTRHEFEALAKTRADTCVSVYLPTTPLTQQASESRIEFRNLCKEAEAQLSEAGFDKRRLARLAESFQDLEADDDFWSFQANSIAVLATPDRLRYYRLANALIPMVQVSDRFHLKPLLRSITFSQTAFVLALSENACRLVEVTADLPAVSVKVEDLPKSAASAVGTANVNSRSPSGRIHGAEGQNVLLRQYARKVDAALRPILAGRHTPLILAATGRLQSLFKSVCSYSDLVSQGIEHSPDQTSDQELADAARPILDDHHAKQIDALRQLYGQRFQQNRATPDIQQAARAATFGAIDTLMVDIDATIPGHIDDDTGQVTLADLESAESYGVIDEILRRTLLNGGRVLGIRSADMPTDGPLAAILRYGLAAG